MGHHLTIAQDKLSKLQFYSPLNLLRLRLVNFAKSGAMLFHQEVLQSPHHQKRLFQIKFLSVSFQILRLYIAPKVTEQMGKNYMNFEEQARRNVDAVITQITIGYFTIVMGSIFNELLLNPRCSLYALTPSTLCCATRNCLKLENNTY